VPSALHENRFEDVKMAETLGFFLFSRRSVKIDFWTPVKDEGFCHFQMCMIFTPYGGPASAAGCGRPAGGMAAERDWPSSQGKVTI
jgi:hypothetical protein